MSEEKTLNDPIASFNKARDAYNDARNNQRMLIARKLEESGYTVPSPGSRNGLARYASRLGNGPKRLEPNFNLKNWKWLVARKTGTDICVVVSFQVVEQDPDTLNLHALVDRISIDVFTDSDQRILSESTPSYQESLRERYKVKYEFEEACFTKICTKFTLPLNQSEIEELVQEIETRVNTLKAKSQLE